jgi:type III secretory pathway lipoprotein EscJ
VAAAPTPAQPVPAAPAFDAAAQKKIAELEEQLRALAAQLQQTNRALAAVKAVVASRVHVELETTRKRAAELEKSASVLAAP